METQPILPELTLALFFGITSLLCLNANAQQPGPASQLSGGAQAIQDNWSSVPDQERSNNRSGLVSAAPSPVESLPVAAQQLLAPASPGTTIAFVDIKSSGPPELGEIVYQQLEPHLLWAGQRYGMTFIERRKLDFIMDEWKLSSFGEAGDKGAQTLLGADYIITASVLDSASGIHYTLKLVNLDNSEIVNITTGQLPSNSGLATSNSFNRPVLAKPATASNRAVSRDGKIRLWTDRQRYPIGSNIVFYFEVREPLYVKLIDVTPDGEKTVLFPNQFQPDGYCKPGIRYQIPPRGGNFSLQVVPPTGLDRVMVLASSTPITEVRTRSMRGIAFTQSLVDSAPTRATITVDIVDY